MGVHHGDEFGHLRGEGGGQSLPTRPSTQRLDVSRIHDSPKIPLSRWMMLDGRLKKPHWWVEEQEDNQQLGGDTVTTSHSPPDRLLVRKDPRHLRYHLWDEPTVCPDVPCFFAPKKVPKCEAKQVGQLRSLVKQL